MNGICGLTSGLFRVTARRVAALAIGLTVFQTSGCGRQPGGLPPARYLADTIQEQPLPQADFSRPFQSQTDEVEQGDLAGLPVAAANLFATSAGGTWVVLAHDALDPVKGLNSSGPSPFNNQQSPPSVADEIQRIRKAGTPIAYDTSHGYVFMVFGDSTDIAKLRASPPDQVTGIYVCGKDPQAAFAALADARREQIKVDPDLAAAWTVYEQRSHDIQTALLTFEAAENPAEFMAETMSPPVVRFEFSNVRRESEADLMSEIAQAAGGAAIAAGAGQWRISGFAPGPVLDGEIKKQKATIDQSAGIGDNSSGDSAGAGTSYAERHGDVSGPLAMAAALGNNSPEATEEIVSQTQEFFAPASSASTALDELGLMGTPVVATLAGYLTPTTPPGAACGALRVLASEPASVRGSRDAIYRYIRTVVTTPVKADQAIQRIATIDYSVGLLSAISKVDGALDPAAADILTKLCTTTDLPQFLRLQARFALLRFGIIPAVGKSPAWNPSAELSFSLTPPPAGHGLLHPVTNTPATAIRPLATAVLSNGDTWAVFVSGRLGNAQDLWLAHATGGGWSEFLFTGKQYTTSQGYTQDSGPKPGGCLLSVSGDSVLIRPKNSQATMQLAALQKVITSVERSDPKKASKLFTQMSQLQQSAGSILNVTDTFSLAALRRDSDGDGLTDIVEQRLGTDPNSRDTPSAGVADGANQNPLVRQVNANGYDRDRQEMLQQVFAALYGGESSLDPIVVVLDAPYRQAFSGGPARILCMTPAEYSQRGDQISNLRSLHFGGPTDADSTILHADGPCLYSDNGDLAEVHFWISTQPLQLYAARAGSDYIAVFARVTNGWTLKSIDTLHFRSASTGNLRFAMGLDD